MVDVHVNAATSGFQMFVATVEGSSEGVLRRAFFGAFCSIFGLLLTEWSPGFQRN